MTPEPAETVVPVVRGLAWTQHPSHAIWRVDCLLGTYKVFAITDVTWTFDGFDGKADSGEAASAEDGFAICQADYERRILEAIDLSALDTAKAEVERWRAYADTLSAVVLGIAPLAGSEAFKQVAPDTFRADPAYFAHRIADMKAAAHEGKLAKAEAATLRERVRVLEAELGWYGEQARLARLIHSEGDEGRWALAEDGGKRARATLTPTEPGAPDV